MSNLKLSWAGDLESLKNFVSDNLKLKGAWKSTGGEKQVFTSGTISITWLSKKKFLSFNGLSDSVKNKLWAAVCCYQDIEETDYSATKACETLQPNSSATSCSCRCQELLIETEGTKLDIHVVILEEKATKRSSSNFDLITKIQDDLVEIRNENSELRCRLNQAVHSNNACSTNNDIDGTEALTKANIAMTDLMEETDATTLEWGGRA